MLREHYNPVVVNKSIRREDASDLGVRGESGKVGPRSSNTGARDTKGGVPRVLASGVDGLSFTIPNPVTVELCELVRSQMGDSRDVLIDLHGSPVLARGGMYGYQCSVERGDVRAFFSLDARQGIHIRVGSAFCMMGLPHVLRGVDMFVDQVLGLDPFSDSADMSMRITRIDVFADVACPMPDPGDFTNVVGRVSTLGPSYWEPGREFEVLQSQYLGSASSSTQMRVYDKLAFKGEKPMYDAADLDAWGVTEDNLPEHVTRFEWQVRVKDAGLEWDVSELMDVLGAFTQYLYDWGRLVVPDPEDSNKSRWEMLPEFAAALAAVQSIVDLARPLERAGHGVSKLLLSNVYHAAVLMAAYAARMTPAGCDPGELGKWDVLEQLERIISMFEDDVIERFRRRYVKESILAA